VEGFAIESLRDWETGDGGQKAVGRASPLIGCGWESRESGVSLAAG
jgi:hypothetical protein